jgi:hypothetical protein
MPQSLPIYLSGHPKDFWKNSEKMRENAGKCGKCGKYRKFGQQSPPLIDVSY